MNAVQNLAFDAVSGPLLVVLPGMTGQIVAPERRALALVCHHCGSANPGVGAGVVSVIFEGGDLLNVADATWEDCEWQ